MVAINSPDPNNPNGAVTSYSIKNDGSLKVLSGPVTNGQGAACWIVANAWGNVFTTNPGSASISSYKDMALYSRQSLWLIIKPLHGITCTDAGITRWPLPLWSRSSERGRYIFQVNFNGTLGNLGTCSRWGSGVDAKVLRYDKYSQN